MELEKNVYFVTVKGVQYPVEFRVSLLSNDMKNAAFLAGELANSAFYFSSYANVNGDTKLDVDLDFTMDTSAKKKLRPFTYEERIDAVKKVNTFKERYPKASRQRITEKISDSGSRQEFMPLVGELVNLMFSEILHLMNNGEKEQFMKVNNVVLCFSDIPSKTDFALLSDSCHYVVFISFVRNTMNCNILGKQLVKHFNAFKGGIHL